MLLRYVARLSLYIVNQKETRAFFLLVCYVVVFVLRLPRAALNFYFFIRLLVYRRRTGRVVVVAPRAWGLHNTYKQMWVKTNSQLLLRYCCCSSSLSACVCCVLIFVAVRGDNRLQVRERTSG